MHNKILRKIAALTLPLACLASLSFAAAAEDTDVDFLFYREARDEVFSTLLEKPDADLVLKDGEITRIYGGKNGTASLPGEKNGESADYLSSSVTLPWGTARLQLPESVIAILTETGNPLDTKGAFFKNADLKTVIPSKSLEYIGDKAFYGSALESIFIPYLTEYLGDSSFAYCKSLEEIAIYGNTVIGDRAFVGCDSLSEVYLSKRIRRVGIGAFEHTPFYDSLTDEFAAVNGILLKYNGKGGDIVIPEGVRIIADGCFAGRASIKSVTLPSTLRYIGSSAFRSCARLETVIFPPDNENVDDTQNLTLGENSFDLCPRLSKESLEALEKLPTDARRKTITSENKHLLKASPISFIDLIKTNSTLEKKEDECTENTTNPPSDESSSPSKETVLLPSDLPLTPTDMLPKNPKINPEYQTIQDVGSISTLAEESPISPQG